MRILMLTSDVSMQCGIARHVLAISTELVKRPDTEVAVCTVYPRGELTEELRKVGVNVYSLNAATGHDPRCLGRFHQVVSDFKPDVIHIHMLALLERVYLAWFRHNIPLVQTTHGISDIGTGIRKVNLRDRLEGWLARKFPISIAKRIYISEGVRQFCHDMHGVVIYNPIRFDGQTTVSHGNIRAELNLAHDTRLIGTACRVTPQKRPQAFVDVMCRVLAMMPDVHALVCGTAEDAHLMDKLRAIVTKHAVGARFHWLGYRKDAADITRQLNCFVMTSVTEGMPTALLEAMAVKTPIAFMRGMGGLADLDLLDRNEGPIGVVADADDNSGMCSRISYMLEHYNQARECAERALLAGKKHFDVSVVADQLRRIYRETIDK